MNDVLDEACRTLAIPKRITTLIRDIWQLQLRMSRRQGKRAWKLMEHPKFRAAYDLLELRAGAENNHELQRLTKWWGEFRVAAPPAQKICSTTSGTILRRAVVTVVRASARRARVAHDSGLYRSWQQPCFSTGAGTGGYPRPGEIPHSRVVAVSSFYRTPPLGPQDQPDYLNAAVALETALPPRRCSIILSASNCSRGECAKPNAGGRARWTSISCCLAMLSLTASA